MCRKYVQIWSSSSIRSKFWKFNLRLRISPNRGFFGRGSKTDFDPQFVFLISPSVSVRPGVLGPNSMFTGHLRTFRRHLSWHKISSIFSDVCFLWVSSFPYATHVSIYRVFVFFSFIYLLSYRSSCSRMAYRKPKYSNCIINSLTRRNIVRTLATHSFHHSPPSDKHPHWRLYWELGIHHEAWRIFFCYRSETDPHTSFRELTKKKHTQITNSVYRIIFFGQHTPIVWCALVCVNCVFLFTVY